MVAVPTPFVNTRPFGSFPESLVTAGVGTPVVVTWNENGVPAVTETEAALVIVGDGLTKALNCTEGM